MMRSYFGKIFIVGLLLMCIVQLAYSDSLYSQTGYSPPFTGYAFGPDPTYYTLNAFYLAQPATATGATFRYWIPPSVQITGVNWLILADNSGSPGAQLFGGSSIPTVTLFANNGYAIYDASFDFGVPITLSGGTYWLGLFPVGPYGSGLSYWDVATGGYSGRYWDSVNQSVIGYSPAHTFSIEGNASVPEPSALLLLGTGLLGIAARVRRFKG